MEEKTTAKPLRLDEKADLVAISELLKLTGSIKAEVIPGIDYEEYIDKKDFTWQLEEYSETSL